MRSSIASSIQQSLTQEAAATVQQALTLARRRGHAQVTPIHVANVMLLSPKALLQRACLKSHTHPLQCKALELCFNVALNRLPTTSPNPVLGTYNSHYPSLSNALVAAFKRAQAHQRRGSVDSQQQPILVLKIEIEQLVVSILDDPSVSRVMREAGFSSTQVKSYVEQSVSLEPTSPNAGTVNVNPDWPEPAFNKLSARNKDVSSVVLSLASKGRRKSNTIVVGECLVKCESVVKLVKERIEKGDVPNELKNAHFMNLPLISMKGFSREETELKLGELSCLLKGYLGRTLVLYLGDLKWVSEYWGYTYGDQRSSLYCPIEHMVMGIKRLLYGNEVDTLGKLRLLGIANFSSYIKCKTGYPSLESLLDLHPLAIPVGSLDFSLKLDSTLEEESKRVGKYMHLTCCSECSANFHGEARAFALSTRNVESTCTAPSLPSWLKKCKEETKEDITNEQGDIKELCMKWNSICNTTHKTINFSSPFSSPSTKLFSCDHKSLENYDFLIPNPPKPDLLSNPNSTPNSATSSEATDVIVIDKSTHFKENNPENLESMISSLEKRVPWQKAIIPDIANTVLRCRAGLIPRQAIQKHETWMVFSGVDHEAKLKVAKELAKLVFGSNDRFKAIKIGALSSPTKADSTEAWSSKRTRHEFDHGYFQKLANAVRDDPHRVFYIESGDQIDEFSQKGIQKAIEMGEISVDGGEMAPLEDAIVIFNNESLSVIRTKTKRKRESDDGDCDNDVKEIRSHNLELDLNLSIIHHDDEDLVGEFDMFKCVDKHVVFKFQVV